MRKLTVASVVVLGIHWFTSIGNAGDYTVRELGFVETGRRPYRLVIFHDASTALAARLAELALAKDLSQTNVMLMVVAIEDRKAHPEFDRLKLPAQLTQPLYLLIGPGERAIPIDPTVAKGALQRSPLRETILQDVADSLCTLVLLDSSDPSANEKAKTKAELVLSQVNKVRTKFHRSPAGEIKLRELPSAGREAERWTLWSLGEDVPVATEPKLAVLFGNLHRAGALLEGSAWDEAELFSRIAGLGQFCDPRDNDYFVAGPLLCFTPPAWRHKVAKALTFDPHDDKIKMEVQTLLKEPTEKLAPRKRWTPGDFGEPKEDPDPPDDNVPHMEPPAPIIHGIPAVSSREASTAILIVGIVGWILLGMTVWIIERRAEA